MKEVAFQEFQERIADFSAEVQEGETLRITVGGVPAMELRPLRIGVEPRGRRAEALRRAATLREQIGSRFTVEEISDLIQEGRKY